MTLGPVGIKVLLGIFRSVSNSTSGPPPFEVKRKQKKQKAAFFKSCDYVGRSFARKEDIGVGRGGVGLTSRIGICSKKSN